MNPHPTDPAAYLWDMARVEFDHLERLSDESRRTASVVLSSRISGAAKALEDFGLIDGASAQSVVSDIKQELRRISGIPTASYKWSTEVSIRGVEDHDEEEG